MITAQVVAELMRAGLTGDALVDALRRIETAAPVTPETRLETGETPLETGETPKVTAAALRQRRWRERQKLQKPPVNTKKPSQPPSPVTSPETGDIEILPVLNLIEEGKESGIARATPPSMWPEFKKAFPKRAGDYDWKKAEVKFNRHVSQGVPPEAMIEGARSYAAWCDAEGKTGTQYVRQPTTWLNNEGWKNDYTPSRKTGFNATFDNLREQVERYSGPDDGAEGFEPPDQARFPI